MISEAQATRSVSCPFCPARVPVVFRAYRGDVLSKPVVLGLAEHDCGGVPAMVVDEQPKWADLYGIDPDFEPLQDGAA